MQEIGLFAVTEFQCTEDEHDDEDEDESKFRNSGLKNKSTVGGKARSDFLALEELWAGNSIN